MNDETKNPLAEAVARAADLIHDDSGEDMRAYAAAHPAIALEAARHNGTLFDMDCMVDLEKALGEAPSWALYTFIGNRLDEDVVTFLDQPEAGYAAELAAMVDAYTGAADTKATASRLGWHVTCDGGRITRLTYTTIGRHSVDVDVDTDEGAVEAVARRAATFDPDRYVCDMIRAGEPMPSGVRGLLADAGLLHRALGELEAALRGIR